MNIIAFLKSIVHNIGVICVGFIFAFVCSRFDLVFHLKSFSSLLFIDIGIFFLMIGFCIRVWATYYFYINNMGVIVLQPQKKLITAGPYRFSRNPLYLGGNVFIFFGASLIFGTFIGVIVTILHLFLINIMIKREEKQLEHRFGKQWIVYKKKVKRWV